MSAGGGWRYIAQRFSGNTGGLGQFIDFNVPLEGVNLEEVLSGHNGLSGTIKPEYPRLKAADGRPILEEWGSAIWAESPDGEIRGGGLLTHSGFNAESGAWEIECTDLTAITIDLPYTEANWWVNVDPMDLFRYIWWYIQRQPNSNLGITIDATTSPKRLGSDLVEFFPEVGEGFDTETAPPPEDLEPAPAPVAPPRYATNKLWREAAVKAMKANNWDADKVDAALKKWLGKDAAIQAGTWEPLTERERTMRDRAIEKIGWPPNPPNPGFRDNVALGVMNARPQVNPPAPADPGAPGEQTTPGPTYQYEAYKLNWYTNLNLAGDIDDLAGSTPFDWHLVHHWNDNDEIEHHIRLGYPRLGRRRPELRFVVGENIHQAPTLERDGAEYANEVLVLGAGEGSSMITARAFRREDDRVRKVITISDPSCTTAQAAQQRADTELAKRFNIDDITDVVLTNHPHAPIGSIDLGDEILVEGDLGWVDLEMWCRVVGRTMSPDDSDSQTLTLIRSDRIG